MHETIHLPGFSAISVSLQHDREPLVLGPKRLRQFVNLTHTVELFLPEDLVSSLLQEVIPFLEGVRKNGITFHGWWLPQVATKHDIHASNRPFLARAFRVIMCGASSSEVGIQDADEVRRQRATLINENPTETLSLQKEFVHVACAGLAVDFVSGIAAVHRDGSPGVNRETSD